MSETEIYFARQNFLWNLGLYFLIGIGVICLIGYIYDRIKYRKYYKDKKKDKKI